MKQLALATTSTNVVLCLPIRLLGAVGLLAPVKESERFRIDPLCIALYRLIEIPVTKMTRTFNRHVVEFNSDSI